MTATLAKIVRHPIKSVGREELSSVDLSPGKWMPFDRRWAIRHERANFEGNGWAKKANFLRGVTGPQLMAVTSVLDPVTKALTLKHPNLDAITVRPDSADDTERVLDWLRRIWPDDLPEPTGVYRASGAHLTDVPDPWISIASLSSLKALSARAGKELSPHRFRANLWIDGLPAWAEKSWIGQTLQIGGVSLTVRQEITRCKATMANPETGRRDADTLDLLNDLGHQEFGVYAEVTEGGEVNLSDPVTPAP